MLPARVLRALRAFRSSTLRLLCPLPCPAGVVEAWAAGCSWGEVMADCNLDDGDMARLLTRTLDLLKQVAGVRSWFVWG